MKQKPWEVEVKVCGVAGMWYWYADCLTNSFTVDGGKEYKTKAGAFREARRVLKRLGLVERKAKAGKERDG